MDSINQVLSGIFVNQTRVFVLVGVLLLVTAELGYRLGLRLNRSQDEPRSKQIEGVQAAVLGLMGLLLAFTFSMAVQRFDQRRQLVVDEANAIGTAFLRTSFLPETARLESQRSFRRYLVTRLERSQSSVTPDRLAAHEAALAQIQQQLWRLASEAAREAPNPITASYAGALNAMIDLDGYRLAASRNHVPGAVWLLLLVLSSMGCWFTGYRAGTLGRRSKLSQISLPLLITVVITLVADLDRPQFGLIGIDEQSLFDLQSLIGDAPSRQPAGDAVVREVNAAAGFRIRRGGSEWASEQVGK